MYLDVQTFTYVLILFFNYLNVLILREISSTTFFFVLFVIETRVKHVILKKAGGKKKDG